MTTSNPTQTTTQQLSPEQQALFSAALPGAQAFATSPITPYQDTTVAPFTPTQTAAQAETLAGAAKAGQIADWSTAGAEALPGTIASSTVPTSSNIFSDPGIWNTAANPGLDAAITAAQRPTWQALTDTALPAIRTGEITAGGYGGSRGQIGEGLATSRAFQTASDQAAKIAEDEYAANLAAVNSRYATNIGANVTQRGQTLSDLLATYGLAPSLQTQQLVPGAAIGTVGDAQQQQAQNELTAQIAQYYQNQPGVVPFLQSQQVLQLLQGLPGGSVTSTGNTPTPNPITGALGGAATGAAIGSVIPGLGTLAGAGIGGAAGTLPFFFH